MIVDYNPAHYYLSHIIHTIAIFTCHNIGGGL